MNGKCLDIGTIQAFLDGETSPDESLEISGHVADCAKCSGLLTVAEDESSFVYAALEREMNTLVPTQRLWSRINESIEADRTRRSFWKQIAAFIAAAFASPSLTAAAGVLVVFGFIAVMWTVRSGDGLTTADVGPVRLDAAVPNAADPLNGVEIQGSPVTSVEPSVISPIQVGKSNLSGEKLERLVRDANTVRPITTEYRGPLPGEESYIKTIADLKETVDGRKDAVFTGSSRVAFERDLAVVNDAISRMQKVVRKNPRNQAARQVLYAAYQDKIDLLNSVAQRDELMATIR